MSESKSGNRGRDALILIAALVVFALVFGGFGLHKLKVGRASAAWPSTQGTITSSRLDSTRSDNKTKYKPEVRYSYTVEGTRHEGSEIDVTSSYTSRTKAEAALSHYRSGASVTVYYDPANHSTALLEPGVGGGVYLMLLAAVGCLVIAVAIGVSAIRGPA